MPDLYPIPGFGPEEILAMAQSALRQVKDYNVSISCAHSTHSERAEVSNEKSPVLDALNALYGAQALYGEIGGQSLKTTKIYDNCIVNVDSEHERGWRHADFNVHLTHMQMPMCDLLIYPESLKSDDKNSVGDKRLLKLTEKIHRR